MASSILSPDVLLSPLFQALIVIVNGDGEHPLGRFLPDHVIIQDFCLISLGVGTALAGADELRLVLFTDDIHAQFDTFVTDKHIRPGDEFSDLVLTLAAERAVKGVFAVCFGVVGFTHL